MYQNNIPVTSTTNGIASMDNGRELYTLEYRLQVIVRSFIFIHLYFN